MDQEGLGKQGPPIVFHCLAHTSRLLSSGKRKRENGPRAVRDLLWGGRKYPRQKEKAKKYASNNNQWVKWP